MSSPKLTVLLLTEDSADGAHATLEALIKKAFRILVPTCQTHAERMLFEPANDTARALMSGNLWKAGKLQGRPQAGASRHRLIDLVRTIVTKVLERDPPGFVVFHVDGDRPWGQRDQSENVEKFEAIVLASVRTALSTVHADDPTAIERALSRIHLFVPFYSMEAWLYQNLSEARRIGAELGHPPDLIGAIEAWEADRTALDELRDPKGATCLGSKYNRRLATTAWPAREVYELDRSFTAAVDGLLACADLGVALEATAS